MNELRKAAQDFADSVDGYENDLPLSAIRAKGALRAALSNNASAAPQDQDAKLDEIRKTLKIGMNIGKALREGINEDIAKDAERYRWLRDHASNDWLDSGITDDAVDAAINDKSQWRKKP